MNPRIPAVCVYTECPSHLPSHDPCRRSPETKHWIRRKDAYYRSSDSRWITRFRCLVCQKSFSAARFSPAFRQKKRKLNEVLRRHLSSSLSQRRAAILFGVNRKTIERKFLYLGEQAVLSQERWLASLKEGSVKDVQFDEMESVERTKLLPLSIPLVVESKTRLILAFDVASMPAKGPLAALSRKKYGPRKDERTQAASRVLERCKPLINPKGKLRSDQNPHYPTWIQKHFPTIRHIPTRGHRSSTSGQGELKKTVFDPLFSFNHTAAMLRANVNRLFRKTWCISKRADRLRLHIALYVQFHNETILGIRAA